MNFRIDPLLRDELDRYSRRTGLTYTVILEHALTEWFWRRACALVFVRFIFAHRALSAAFAVALVKLVLRVFAAPVPALPPFRENSVWSILVAQVIAVGVPLEIAVAVERKSVDVGVRYVLDSSDHVAVIVSVVVVF
jgi:hypothetical protein